MCRSSSSSVSNAVADEAAVARERRRLVVRSPPRSSRARRRGRRARRAGCVTSGAWHSASSTAQARHRRQRLAQARPDRAARRWPAPRATSAARGPGRLQRLAQLAAIGACGTPAPRPRRGGRGSLRARSSGRSSQVRSSRPPIGVTVRSISSSSDPSRPPSVASTISRCFERGRIDEQAVGGLAQADAADVGEVGLLRVAQVPDQRAARRTPPPGGVRGRSLRGADAQLIEQRLPRATRARNASRRSR